MRVWHLVGGSVYLVIGLVLAAAVSYRVLWLRMPERRPDGQLRPAAWSPAERLCWAVVGLAALVSSGALLSGAYGVELWSRLALIASMLMASVFRVLRSRERRAPAGAKREA